MSATPVEQLNTNAFPTSWEKAIEVFEYIAIVIDRHDAIEFAIKTIAPNLPSQNQENKAVAKRLGVGRSTVEGWRTDANKCSVPIKLSLSAAKKIGGPEELIHAFSKYSGENHSQYFDWIEE